MSFSETISPLLGRWALSWFFGNAAMDILYHWSSIVAQLGAKHLPLPPLLLIVALLMIVMGVVSLLFGYHTRYGAVILFGLTIAAAFAMHDFWHFANTASRRGKTAT